MLYKKFYYMVFTCNSAGKMWSSIFIQDIVKPELNYQINLTRFPYQICLTDKSYENNYFVFRKLRRIKNPVKHLR